VQLGDVPASSTGAVKSAIAPTRTSVTAIGLNLIVSAFVLWNTTYLQRAVDHLKRQGYYPTPGDLAHLSPLGREHINLTGDYYWEASSALGPDQFRPLRTRVQGYAAAA
jgi:hypothetical protein